METFAEKVRYGGVARFDLLMEEKGGWISEEAEIQQDREIVKAVIEVMAKASQHILVEAHDPFRAQYGEILPADRKGTSRVS